jgi:hypothetical protein
MLRRAIVAAYLLSRLSEPPKDAIDEKAKPAQSGSAKWIFHDGVPELWFNWTTVWGEVNEIAQPRVEAWEQQSLNDSLLATLNEKQWPISQPRQAGRKRFYRWTERHLEALARLASGEEGAA